MEPAALLEAICAASVEAGEAIRAIRRRGCEHRMKADSSPVTEADHAAEAILLDALARAAPGIPVVAEEEAAAGRIPDLGDRFFLVDPLDGTKEFIRGGDDYTVNVGLVTRAGPILGVVLAPESGHLFAGIVGEGAFMVDGGVRRSIAVREAAAPLTVVASRSHLNAATERYLAEQVPGAERRSIGSSLKFCLVAGGEADLYPRLSPTCEWDTAAGHAVLAAAGGWVDGPDGRPLGYGKPGFLNPGFLASAGVRTDPIGRYL